MITWNVQIRVENISTKIVSATATRIDDAEIVWQTAVGADA